LRFDGYEQVSTVNPKVCNPRVCKFLQWWKAPITAIAVALAFTAASMPADAGSRHPRHSRDSYRAERHYRAQSHEDADNPRFAAIVIDGNSGSTLFARNEHALRHPASVTKVMTLYLLFEQLENGRFRLDSPLMISAHAAAQAPTKLGLSPGRTIEVEDAIKAVVTKSANDIAVVIAENIAGDEETFAEMMTAKAHGLGMTHTHYANASGLPNDQQITTAYDLALLGRAIQDRFPAYFNYFSTPAFVYRGRVHRNHNHLLGQIRGVDGIKTGYTRDSGFNLLTSVHRNGISLVAVVLGGRTAASRDRTMAGLIKKNADGGAKAIAEDGSAEQSAAKTVAPRRTVGRSDSRGGVLAR
jgi:D-alanyl-D-alanine carboxypeptidase